jgi:DDE family transposase
MGCSTNGPFLGEYTSDCTKFSRSSCATCHTSAFTYDADRDLSICPQGELLRFRGMDYPNDSKQYRARAATCQGCVVRRACTNNQQGRLIRRSLYADYLDRVRAYHQTPAYKKAMRKRGVWIEPLFAEAKQWHGLRRFRVRGLPNGNMQALLIATGQNLKRYLAARGWGRRFGPSGSLSAPSDIPAPAPVPS